VPPGFSIVCYYSAITLKRLGQPQTWVGAKNEYIWCYRRSRERNPLAGMMLLEPQLHDSIPEGYTLIERTAHVADMSRSATSSMFLAIPGTDPAPSSCTEWRQEPSRYKARMRAYYSTGGATIASTVDRFHIIGTHPLLSSSSVTTRLCLIQA